MDEESAPRGRAWAWVLLAAGAVLGAVAGAVWELLTEHAHDHCAVADAQNPESYCALGFFVVTLPVMVLAAGVAVGLATWILLAAVRLRPRAGLVLLAFVLTLVGGAVFAWAGSFALEHPSPWRILAPTLVLGAGMGGLAALSGVRRTE